MNVALALKHLFCKEGCSIEHLDLADNSFGVDGAQALSSLLILCNDLNYLDLRDCLLIDEGIRLISDSLIAIVISLSPTQGVASIHGTCGYKTPGR